MSAHLHATMYVQIGGLKLMSLPRNWFAGVRAMNPVLQFSSWLTSCMVGGLS